MEKFKPKYRKLDTPVYCVGLRSRSSAVMMYRFSLVGCTGSELGQSAVISGDKR
jgi:hypothetical protein